MGRQKDSLRQWEEQRDETRRQNQMLNHKLKMQANELEQKKEQRFIEEEFSKMRIT